MKADTQEDPAIKSVNEKIQDKLEKKKQEKALKEIVDNKQMELPIDSKIDLKALAIRIYKGEVFTSQQMHKEDAEMLLPSVFMPLVFLDEKQRKQLLDDKAAVFYADMKDAGPRSINGYPMFFSMGYLTTPEWNKIVQYINKLKKLEKELEV